tara:strand:+ start:290 stop:523 length:234 start_codon:yes stop_codon:yes gene_type:complete
MTKQKKQEKKELTVSELHGIVSRLEQGMQNAVNNLSQTLTDYVTFNNDYNEFLLFLKGKYQKQGESDGGKESKENTK